MPLLHGLCLLQESWMSVHAGLPNLWMIIQWCHFRMKNNPIFFFQTKIAAFCCRSVCSSSVYYPPFNSVLSVFIFHLPYKLTQGGAGSLVHVVEAAAVAVVALFKVVRCAYVRVHLLLLALHLGSGGYSNRGLVYCILRPALALAWHWARDLPAVAGGLCLLSSTIYYWTFAECFCVSAHSIV